MAPADAPRRRMLPVVVAVAVTTVGWVVANIVWLAQHRSGQPLNIDEAGYLGISLNYGFSWERGGLPAWLTSVFYPSIQAPLTTAVTSLVAQSSADRQVVAFGVILAFAALTVVFLTAFAVSLRRQALVVIAVALVLSCPGFLALSRFFVFAMPAAAVTMFALYALLRTRGLTSTGWSVVFGVAVGLMPLTRTMLISFGPVLLAVAVVHALGRQGVSRVRQAVHVVLAGLIALAVAATWLVPSASLVFGYLTEYGYGKHSADYSRAQSPPLRLLGALGQDFFLPHLVLIGVGWVLVLALSARTSRRSWKARLGSMAAAPLFPCAAFVVLCCGALMSSKNGGFGFTLPLLAPAALVAASGWTKALDRIRAKSMRRGALGAGVLVCAVLAYPLFVPSSVLAAPRSVSVLGASVIVTHGRGDDPAYFLATRTGPGAAIRNRDTWADDWERANHRLTDEMLDGSTERPDFALGFRDRFMNVNTVQLQVVERLKYGVGIAQVDPTQWGTSRSDYVTWLTEGPAATSCQLLLATGATNEFEPLPQEPNLRAAAQQVGFHRVDGVGLPDGRTVTVWERSGDGC